MPSSTQKKTAPAAAPAEKTPAENAAAAPAKVALPALVAFHAIPAPEGKPPILTPIGSAVAHEDGQGFTLDLQLMPTTGGRIILRTLKANQPSNAA